MGLIYESEGTGTHWLKRVEYPNYRWKYDQTYWVYSENLFAAYALLPWAPEIAHEINETIKRYNPPFSGKFEAVIGQAVGPDRQARDIIVNETENFAVLIRIHDGLVSDPRYHFADAQDPEWLQFSQRVALRWSVPTSKTRGPMKIIAWDKPDSVATGLMDPFPWDGDAALRAVRESHGTVVVISNEIGLEVNIAQES